MENNNQKKKKRLVKIAVAIIIIVVAMLLLLSRCSSGTSEVLPPVIQEAIGNFDITGEQMEKPTVEQEQTEVPMITFSGYGKYEVSKGSPTVELKNPEGNFVNMVFTLTDKASGEIIARTPPVASGKFAYVNVYDFYQKSGTYNVEVVVSTFDSETNQPMNGINQNMKIVVK